MAKMIKQRLDIKHMSRFSVKIFHYLFEKFG